MPPRTMPINGIILEKNQFMVGIIFLNADIDINYKVDGVNYYVATNRFDIATERVATINKLRWSIETFIKWWKKH